MHGTFNRGAAGGSQSMITDNSSKQSPSTLIINKKSDWTMDMPKIEYQPEQDDDEDDDDKDGDHL